MKYTCTPVPEPKFDARMRDSIMLAKLTDAEMKAFFPNHYPNTRVDALEENLQTVSEAAAGAAQENSNRIGNLTNGTITRDENGNIASITTFDEATTINRDEDGILTGWENSTHTWTITRDESGNFTGWTFTEKE